MGCWVVDGLEMRVGAYADELCLLDLGPGCVGGAGSHSVWIVSGLVSLFRLWVVGSMIGCVVNWVTLECLVGYDVRMA